MACTAGKEAGPQPMHVSGTYTFNYMMAMDNLGNGSSWQSNGVVTGLETDPQTHNFILSDLVLE